jgi:hypothetical protein
MRLHHIAFGVAAITGAFAFAAPMAWDRHVGLVLLTVAVVAVGLVLATGSKLLDLLHPARTEHYSRRDVNRAFDAGHDHGASAGPSEETRRRWQREGFEA